MTRDTLIAYLQGQYGGLAAAAGWSSWPTVADQVFRLFGVAEAGLPTATADDSLIPDAWALGDYYALRGICRALSTFADIHAGDPQVSKARSQVFKQTMQLLDQARDLVPAQYDVEPGDFALGRLELDYIEPIYGYGYGPSPSLP